MKRLYKNNNGFIPLIVVLVIVIVAVLVIAYLRVSHASH